MSILFGGLGDGSGGGGGRCRHTFCFPRQLGSLRPSVGRSVFPYLVPLVDNSRRSGGGIIIAVVCGDILGELPDGEQSYSDDLTYLTPREEKNPRRSGKPGTGAKTGPYGAGRRRPIRTGVVLMVMEKEEEKREEWK